MLHDNTGQELQSPNFKMSEKEKLDKSFKRAEVASTKLITRYDKVHENVFSKDKLHVERLIQHNIVETAYVISVYVGHGQK